MDIYTPAIFCCRSGAWIPALAERILHPTGTLLVAYLFHFGYNPSMNKNTPNTAPLLVVCRKTGRTYDPRTEFLKVMETKEVREVMVRLKNR